MRRNHHIWYLIVLRPTSEIQRLKIRIPCGPEETTQSDYFWSGPKPAAMMGRAGRYPNHQGHHVPSRWGSASSLYRTSKNPIQTTPATNSLRREGPTCTDNDVIFRKPDLKRRREADNVRIFRVDVSSRQAPPVPLPCFPTYRPGHRRGTLHPRSSHRPSLSQTRRNTGRKRAPSFRLWFPPYRHFMAATPAVDPTAAHTSALSEPLEEGIINGALPNMICGRAVSSQPPIQYPSQCPRHAGQNFERSKSIVAQTKAPSGGPEKQRGLTCVPTPRMRGQTKKTVKMNRGDSPSPHSSPLSAHQ
ncbi:hypothetical protein Bbelb_443880 [Branchiostoma belcheri]|nr:hypothetical protein Bbelb_443880 [Branchiostoma belcheri]